MSVFELFNQPFNVVHEMYRLVFLKNKYQKEKEEKEKAEAEAKAKQEQKAHEEQLRNNVPAFATKSYVLGKEQTPPQSKTEQPDKAPTKETKNSSTSTPMSDAVVAQMVASDMQATLEEVIS